MTAVRGDADRAARCRTLHQHELAHIDDGIAVGAIGQNARAVSIEIVVLVDQDDEPARGIRYRVRCAGRVRVRGVVAQADGHGRLPFHGFGSRHQYAGHEVVRRGRHGPVALKLHDVRYAYAEQDARHEQSHHEFPERKSVLRRVSMAADYTEAPAATGGWPDDRQRPSDERLLVRAAYVNPAQRRGRPSASRAETRGRPV